MNDSKEREEFDFGGGPDRYEADFHPDLQPDNPPYRPTRAIIDLDCFLENYHQIVSRAGEGTKIVGVVKADVRTQRQGDYPDTADSGIHRR